MARTLVVSTNQAGEIADGDFILCAGTLRNASAVEALRTAMARIPGHFCRLGGQCPSVTNGLAAKFFKNGAAGTQSVLIGGGWFQTADSDSVVAGDLWSVAGVGGVSGQTVYTVRMVFSADVGHSTYYIGLLDVDAVNGTTSYFVPAGYGFSNNSSDESRNQIKIETAGTIGNLEFYSATNAIVTDTVISITVNSTPRLIKTVPALTSDDLFENTSDTWTVSPGDLIGIKIVAGADSGHNIFEAFVGFSFTATSGSASDIFGTTLLRTSNFSDTRYIPIAGNGGSGEQLPERVICRTGFPATATKSRFHIDQNAKPTDTNIPLYVNGVASALVATIPAGGIGWYDSGLTSASFGEDDDLYFAIESTSLGILGIDTYGMTLTDDGGGTVCNLTTIPPDVGTPTVGTDDDVSYTPRTYITKVRQLKPYPRLPINEYEVGEGGKSKFPVSFRVMSQTDLRVTVDDVELDQSDFTLDGELVNDGTAVTDGVVRIWSDPAPKRETDLVAAGIAMVGVNDAMQTLWVCDIAQQLRLKRQTVLAFAAAHTFTEAESGGLYKSVTATLPTASWGLHYDLNGGSATRAGSDTIYDGSASGTVLTAGSSDAFAHLISPKAGLWFVAKKTGTWSLA